MRIEDGISGEPVGVLRNILSLNSVQEIATAKTIAIQDIEVTILTADGPFLAETSSSHNASRILNPEVMLDDSLTKAMKEALASGSGEGYRLDDVTVTGFARSAGASYYDNVPGFDGLDWRVIVQQPTEVALAPLAGVAKLEEDLGNSQQNLNLTIIGVGVLMAVVALLVALWQSRSITVPVSRLRDAAERIRAGEEDVEILVDSHDEIGDLSVSFDRMHSQRNMAERALRDSEKRFRDLSDLLPQMVVEIDLEGNALFANQFGLRSTGYTQEDLRNGINVFDVFDPESRERIIANAVKLIGGEEYQDHDYTMVRKDGSTLPVLVYADTIVRDDQVVGIRGIILDITERKKAEYQLNEKNEELVAAEEELRELNQHLEEKVKGRTIEIENLLKQKEEFISQLGHDLRSPLTPLVGLIPTIRKLTDDAKSLKLLDAVSRNVKYMKNLVEETVQLAKLNSAEMEFNIADVNLLNALEDLLERKEFNFTENSINIENRVTSDITVVADELRLVEVFDNLTGNAIKFMPEGGSIIFDAGSEGELVRISVHDTGVGVDEEQLTRIFNDFYKVDESRHELGSAGLGLSICKRIVEKQGGSIWAESDGPGKGTTFCFTVPNRSGNTQMPEIKM